VRPVTAVPRGFCLEPEHAAMRATRPNIMLGPDAWCTVPGNDTVAGEDGEKDRF